MDKFELRPVEDGLELKGGRLTEPLLSREADAEQQAIHLVGFMSQRDGAVLRIMGEAGAVIATKEFLENPIAPGAVGSLAGPS